MILLLVTGACMPLGAQEPPVADSAAVRPFAGGGVAVTRIHAETTVIFELAAGLSFARGLSLGGAARLVPAPVEVGEVLLQDVELELGYGGLLLELRRPAGLRRTEWLLRLLVGAGNGDVVDRGTSLRLDSDNFIVLEPAVGLDVGLSGRVRAGAAASYRFVSGVQDLRGVEASDLRSPALVLHLRISPL